jgi:hypothetical protein
LKKKRRARTFNPLTHSPAESGRGERMRDRTPALHGKRPLPGKANRCERHLQPRMRASVLACFSICYSSVIRAPFGPLMVNHRHIEIATNKLKESRILTYNQPLADEAMFTHR